MRDEIILIGPLCSGKTSVALCLADRLSLLSYPVDRIKWYYRFKNGYDLAHGNRILRQHGFMALLDYSEKFFTLTELETMLSEFRGGVVDFGASHSYYCDPEQLQKAVELLAPFKNVVLLQPSPDVDECIEVLSPRIRERYAKNWRSPKIIESYVAANLRFVTHKSNSILAKYVVYTNGKTVEEVAQAVLDITAYSTGHEEKPYSVHLNSGRD